MGLLLQFLVIYLIMAAILNCDVKRLWNDTVLQAIRNCIFCLLSDEDLIVNTPEEHGWQDGIEEVDQGFLILLRLQTFLIVEELCAEH